MHIGLIGGIGPAATEFYYRGLFDRHGFHHLLVTEQSRLVGLVSDRDLLRALRPFIGKLSERPLDLVYRHRNITYILHQVCLSRRGRSCAVPRDSRGVRMTHSRVEHISVPPH